MPKLLFISGAKKGQTRRLKEKTISIGRDPGNTLFIPDGRISRRHAVLTFENGGYVIEDLGSVNGTLINETPVTREQLQIGDTITLGTTVLKYVSLLNSDKFEPNESTLRVEILPEDQTVNKINVEKTLISEKMASSKEELEKADKNTIHRAYGRLMILYQTSHNLNEIIELPQLFDRILELIMEVITADRGLITLWDKETGTFIPRSVRLGKTFRDEEKIGLSKTIISQVVSSGQSLLISDAREDERFMEEESVVLHDVRSAMCVPIKGKEAVLGIIYVDTKGKTIGFDEEDLELMTAIGNQAAVAMEKVTYFENLRKVHEELKNHQEQLLQSERLSAMGRLAGGIAHEINNPLTSILGFADLISTHFDHGQLNQKDLKKCIGYINILKNEATRCKQITQGLLQLSQPKKGKKVPTDLNSVLETTLNVAQFHIQNHNIDLVTDFQPDLPLVLADGNHLQQVFLNLIINAKDAMTQGGTLKISSWGNGSKWVGVTFEDTGCGMPEEEYEKIFMPLYTTKLEGNGTGLGLSISQTIIEDHKGIIDVKSREGEGSTFIIRFSTADS